jgi:hypothetical protein
MATVQSVFSVSTPQEFAELVTLCNYVVDQSSGLAIVKSNSTSKTDIYPPVKGLIYRPDTGHIVAPGVYTPKDVDLKDVPSNAVAYSMALDGVLIRIYLHEGQVKWSTTGMIDPTNGRWGSERTFGSMFQDVSTFFHGAGLKEGLCYFTVMEHSDLLSFYRPAHSYSMLTLVRVVDMYGNTEPLENLHLYKDVFQIVLEIKPAPLQDLEYLEDTPEPGPVTYEQFGVNVYLPGNDMVRVLSKHAQKAISLVPNLSKIWQHWIFCVKTGGYDMIDLYTKFFPWRKEEFDRYTLLLRQTYGEDISNVTKYQLQGLIL